MGIRARMKTHRTRGKHTLIENIHVVIEFPPPTKINLWYLWQGIHVAVKMFAVSHMKIRECKSLLMHRMNGFASGNLS